MNKKIEIGLTILIIVGVVALLFFAYNQVLGYAYKKQLLESPCQLCCELNKNYECPKELNINMAFNISKINNTAFPSIT